MEEIDLLIEKAVFEDKSYQRKIIEAAEANGVTFSSIQRLYNSMGRGDISGFTVPAINIRGLTYDVAQVIFRVAQKLNSGAFIFEIARSEIGYTDQRPLEYSACIAAAALKTDYRGPVFIQGDHFQVNVKNPEKDLSAIKELIKESVDANFFNIDIDASTVVDISKEDLKEQQFKNSKITAELTKFIREIEPKEISIGGEIGEVGGRNSTPEDLRIFMELYLSMINNNKGLSKISVQTGTSHGGVVMPDGSIAKVKIDFDVLKKLSEIARKEFGMAGAVQHGASTLPEEYFDTFPKVNTAEIHLATGFQNIIYDNIPSSFKKYIYDFVKENFAKEWKRDRENEEQFIYKTRKKAFGPLKKEWWNLSKENKNTIMLNLERKFELIFTKLKVTDTKDIVDNIIL